MHIKDPDPELADMVESAESQLEWFARGAAAMGYITSDQAAVISGPDFDRAVETVRTAFYFKWAALGFSPDAPGNEAPDWRRWPEGKPLVWRGRRDWDEVTDSRLGGGLNGDP
jgi:hypothetical protein